MTCDPAHRYDVLTTNLTTVQVRVALVRRQLPRREGLRERDRQWLETTLTAIERAVHEMAAVIVEEEAPPHAAAMDPIPPLHLLALPRRDNRN